MNNKKYCDAMAEMLYYFNGIDENEIKKIPAKLMNYFKDNATKDYVCDFDYNRPLKELNLKDETKALICMIYINYICDNQEKKQKIISKLNENEIKYQEELKKKYSTENLFKNNIKTSENENNQVALVEYKKDKWYRKIIMKIRKFLRDKC